MTEAARVPGAAQMHPTASCLTSVDHVAIAWMAVLLEIPGPRGEKIAARLAGIADELNAIKAAQLETNNGP